MCRPQNITSPDILSFILGLLYLREAIDLSIKLFHRCNLKNFRYHLHVFFPNNLKITQNRNYINIHEYGCDEANQESIKGEALRSTEM